MRTQALLTALVLAMAPAIAAPAPAFADGIERPHVRHRPHRRPQPIIEAPARAVIEMGPETVTLNNSFFAASSGGVGTDIGTGYVGGGTTVIVGGSSASAFAFASARASAGGFGGGRRGGGHGGGCGCGH